MDIFNNNLKIFNVRVKDENLDESRYANNVAEYLGLKLIEEELNLKKYIELYKKCIALEDLPLLHPNSVGIHLISQRAKEEGISVLLSGEGADELFGGYAHYRYFYIRLLLKKIPLFYYLLKKSKVSIYDEDFTGCLLEDGDYIIEYYKNLPAIYTLRHN